MVSAVSQAAAVALMYALGLSAAERSAVQSAATRGSAFIQTHSATVAHEGYGSEPTGELEVCQGRVVQLERELEALRQRLEGKGSCERPFAAGAGACAVFGDPHFTTFDGAHTILLKEQTLWVVKSQDIWIQALSHESTGNLMGLAVSGPFMQGHTLIFANTTEAKGNTSKPFTVLFNDKPILDNWDNEGRSDFNFPDVLSATRRADWNLLLHDRQILEMDDAIEWDVGSWETRFSHKPKGGLYLFKLGEFPNGVELTATGADLMSAVVKMMPQESGQSGFCGNFNGKAEDDFTPPEAGSVADALVPAWNVPVGESLEPVPEHLDLFKTSALMRELFPAVPAGSHRESQPTACPQDLLNKAESACGHLRGDNALRAACVADVCASGDVAAADEVADGVTAVAVLEGTLTGP